MGGLVFANSTSTSGNPIQVPRLPPSVYHKVVADCETKLESLFHRVVVPRAHPPVPRHKRKQPKEANRRLRRRLNLLRQILILRQLSLLLPRFNR